ncbi:hypothetical protein [Arthrobacter pigmenti]
MVDKDWLAGGLGDMAKADDAENAANVGDTESAGTYGNAENGGNAEETDNRYRKLPERIRVEDMVAAKETRPVPDPKMGRDTETDFLLRHAGGFG